MKASELSLIRTLIRDSLWGQLEAMIALTEREAEQANERERKRLAALICQDIDFLVNRLAQLRARVAEVN